MLFVNNFDALRLFNSMEQDKPTPPASAMKALKTPKSKSIPWKAFIGALEKSEDIGAKTKAVEGYFNDVIKPSKEYKDASPELQSVIEQKYYGRVSEHTKPPKSALSKVNDIATSAIDTALVPLEDFIGGATEFMNPVPGLRGLYELAKTKDFSQATKAIEETQAFFHPYLNHDPETEAGKKAQQILQAMIHEPIQAMSGAVGSIASSAGGMVGPKTGAAMGAGADAATQLMAYALLFKGGEKVGGLVEKLARKEPLTKAEVKVMDEHLVDVADKLQDPEVVKRIQELGGGKEVKALPQGSLVMPRGEEISGERIPIPAKSGLEGILDPSYSRLEDDFISDVHESPEPVEATKAAAQAEAPAPTLPSMEKEAARARRSLNTQSKEELLAEHNNLLDKITKASLQENQSPEGLKLRERLSKIEDKLDKKGVELPVDPEFTGLDEIIKALKNEKKAKGLESQVEQSKIIAPEDKAKVGEAPDASIKVQYNGKTYTLEKTPVQYQSIWKDYTKRKIKEYPKEVMPTEEEIKAGLSTKNLLTDNYSQNRARGRWEPTDTIDFNMGVNIIKAWENIRDWLKTDKLTFGDHFWKEGVGAKLKEGPAAAKAIGESLATTFAPASTTAGKVVAGVLRKQLGQAKVNFYRAENTLKEARKYFGQQTKEANYDYIDSMESAQVGNHLPPEHPMYETAGAISKLFDDRRRIIENEKLAKGIEWIQHYFPHIWKHPDLARYMVERWEGSKQMEGNKAFLKERQFMTVKEGREVWKQIWKDAVDKIQKGQVPTEFEQKILATGGELELVSNNPVDLVLLKVREMDKFIAAKRTVKQLMNMGMVEVVPDGEKPLLGWKYLDDGIGSRRLAAPANAARVINNYLSPGLRHNAAFNLYANIANTMNQFQLGYSAFHLGFTSFDANVSQLALALNAASRGDFGFAMSAAIKTPVAFLTNPIKGNRLYHALVDESHITDPTLKAITQMAIDANMSPKMDTFYRTSYAENFKKALNSHDYISALTNLPFMPGEFIGNIIMEQVVPRQKLGVFYNLAEYELRRMKQLNPLQAQEILGRIADSVDNRMGQLNTDNLFWNNAVKDLSIASVRSMSWNLGTFREILGGVADFGKQVKDKSAELSYRSAYVLALPILVGMYGATIQYLSTGEAPSELKDYFFPKIGGVDPVTGRPRRISLPSYMKDVAAWWKKPGQTAVDKLNPLISEMAEQWNNKDFYGSKIANESDPLVKRMQERVKHSMTAFVPFSFRSSNQPGEGPITSKLPFIGVTKAPSYVTKTPAEFMASEFHAQRQSAGGMDIQAKEKQMLKVKVEGLLRSGQPIPKEMQEGLRNLSSRDFSDIRRKSAMEPLQISFEGLSLDEAMSVWKVTSPKEKKELNGYFAKKIYNAAQNGNITMEQKLRLRDLFKEEK